MLERFQFRANIYTDWANHYLEKAHYKRLITDLQHDFNDGLLLADVIHAVIGESVPCIKPKPRNAEQMVENISTCLTFLIKQGVNVEGLNAKDVKDGNLKATLGLFFSLSRFKQQQKTLSKAKNTTDMLSRLPLKSSDKSSSTASADNSGKSDGLASGIPTTGGRIARSGIPSSTKSTSASSNKTSMFKFFNTKEKNKPQKTGTLTKCSDNGLKDDNKEGRGKMDSKGQSETLRVRGSKSNAALILQSAEKCNITEPHAALKALAAKKSALNKHAVGNSPVVKAVSSKPPVKEDLSSRHLSPPSTQNRAPSPKRLGMPGSSRESISSMKSDRSDASSPGVARRNAMTTSMIPKTPSTNSISRPSKSMSSNSVGKSSSTSGSLKRSDMSSIPRLGSSRSSSKEDTSLKHEISSIPSAPKSVSSRTTSTRTGLPSNTRVASRQSPPRTSTATRVSHQSHLSKSCDRSVDNINSSALNKHNTGTPPKVKAKEASATQTSVSSLSKSNLRTLERNSAETRISRPTSSGSSGKESATGLPRPRTAGRSIGKDGKSRATSVSSNGGHSSASQIRRPLVLLHGKTGGKPKADSNTQTDASALQKLAAQVQKSPSKELENQKGSNQNMLRKEAGNQTTKDLVSNSVESSGKENHISDSDPRTNMLPTYKSLSSNVEMSNISGQSSSGSVHTNSSQDSIVLNKSTCDVPQLDAPKSSMVAGKIETTFDASVPAKAKKETTLAEDDIIDIKDIKPMAPIQHSTPYSFLKPGSANAFKSSRLAVKSDMGLRRTSNCSSSAYDTDSDMDSVDISAGYVSDGDILKTKYFEDFSGYLSEGGASMYARRIQQRFREGMQAVRECMQQSTDMIDSDSFDDESSVSSGDISEVADIGLDEALNPYSAYSESLKEKSEKSRHSGWPPKSVNNEPNNGSVLERSSWYKDRNDVKNSSDYISNSGSLKKNTNALVDRTTPSQTVKIDGGSERLTPQLGSNMFGFSRPLSAIGSRLSQPLGSNDREGLSDNPPERYSTSTLDRRTYRHPMAGSKTQNSLSSSPDVMTDSELYKSNTLGRRRADVSLKDKLFGSRGSLNKSPIADPIGTIISNPHATFSKRHVRNSIGGEYPMPHHTHQQSEQYLSAEYLANSSNYGPNPTSPMVWLKGTKSHSSGLAQTESMESVSSSASSSVQAQIQLARARGLASARLLSVQRAGSTQVQRSNSIKSTKSECGVDYSRPLDMSRSGSYNQLNNPLSPSRSEQYSFPMTSSMSSASVHAMMTAGLHRADGDRGSSLSLASNSSIYSTPEEKQAAEIRKLRRELDSAQDKVSNLTTQLTTNAHVVSAFEQSLANMTVRLQQLTSTAEQKDNELSELRATIDALKQQHGIKRLSDVGLISPEMSRRHMSVSSTGSVGGLTRQLSSESLSSLSSTCSTTSAQSCATDVDGKKSKKKKSWLRSSFSKAFSGKRKKDGDVDIDARSEHSVPCSPMLSSDRIKSSQSASIICGDDSDMEELKRQLRDKDSKLTDTRLDALSSAHQLEQMREMLNQMKTEMGSLKSANDRLQRMSHHSSLTSSCLSIPQQLADKEMSVHNETSDGKLVTVSVSADETEDVVNSTCIGSVIVCPKTKWDMLDSMIRRIFKEYIVRVDAMANMGLNSESIIHYRVGEVERSNSAEVPELLPWGYLVGETTDMQIYLRGTSQSCVDTLAFQTLIPKSILQRYISLLLEHKRIILCGPSGTGKTYLAHKMAEHLVKRSGKKLLAGTIATFNVEHKSSKDLRQYLSNIAEQCENSTFSELPSVVILDNLHHVGSLTDIFNGFLSHRYQKCPYIIGTTSQTSGCTTNLQLHHNFRWVLCANHMEPVKGFLSRYLRRKLADIEVKSGVRNSDLAKVIDWVPKVWQHLNKFLEVHSSADVAIGPRLFLSCPMDIDGSQIWLTDLWNYSIVPYLLEAVRDGIQTYGRRAAWDDPTDWMISTYPWTQKDEVNSLVRLRVEDICYDSSSKPSNDASNDKDPLLNMLMKLQEAASYPSPNSNDSDSASLDSHVSTGIESAL